MHPNALGAAGGRHHAEGRNGWRCAVMLASPARRLTREQHLTKFRRCLDFAKEPLCPGTSDTLIDLVDHLEQLSDIRELTEPLLA
jgi:hypothetical protein